eukprot:gene2690-3464_t
MAAIFLNESFHGAISDDTLPAGCIISDGDEKCAAGVYQNGHDTGQSKAGFYKLCYFQSSDVEESAACPRGWKCVGGIGYKAFFSAPLDWKSAQLYCEALGGSLATIESQEQNDARLRFLDYDDLFIVWFSATAIFRLR